MSHEVYCLSCGVRTIFSDDYSSQDNDMITRESTDHYKCNSCGLKTGDLQKTFRVDGVDS